jgi:hypothetical protein
MTTKPTKVTQEDLELEAELSRITAIKTLLDGYYQTLRLSFAELSTMAEQSNPVATYIAILNEGDALETGLQLLQAELLKVLAEVEDEDAHELADQHTEPVADPVSNQFIDQELNIDPVDEPEDDADDSASPINLTEKE